MVAHMVRRKMKMTSTTRRDRQHHRDLDVITAASVTRERSDIRATCTEGGIDCSRCGMIALMRFTRSMVLAPGARRICDALGWAVVVPGADCSMF